MPLAEHAAEVGVGGGVDVDRERGEGRGLRAEEGVLDVGAVGLGAGGPDRLLAFGAEEGVLLVVDAVGRNETAVRLSEGHSSGVRRRSEENLVVDPRRLTGDRGVDRDQSLTSSSTILDTGDLEAAQPGNRFHAIDTDAVSERRDRHGRGGRFRGGAVGAGRLKAPIFITSRASVLRQRRRLRRRVVRRREEVVGAGPGFGSAADVRDVRDLEDRLAHREGPRTRPTITAAAVAAKRPQRRRRDVSERTGAPVDARSRIAARWAESSAGPASATSSFRSAAVSTPAAAAASSSAARTAGSAAAAVSTSTRSRSESSPSAYAVTCQSSGRIIEHLRPSRPRGGSPRDGGGESSCPRGCARPRGSRRAP